MSTKNTSIVPSRKLELLVLDGDIDPELAIYLQAVGFKVSFAPRGSNLIRDDVKVLRHARKRGGILVCHDQHSDKETRLRLYPELYKNGGKILQIGGDSSQPILTALGKVCVWRENWEPWFKKNDGKIIVYRDRWIPKLAIDLANLTISQQSFDIGKALFIQRRKARKKAVRRKTIAPEQKRLLD